MRDSFRGIVLSVLAVAVAQAGDWRGGQQPSVVQAGLSDESPDVPLENSELVARMTTLQDEPVRPATQPITQPSPNLPSTAAQFASSIFASDSVRRSAIASRGTIVDGGAELAFGSEGKFRVTTDGANLLGKVQSTPAVRVQERTPIVNDPYVRGSANGRTLASGSFWAPARQDLDTILSKIDSRLIQDAVVVKGPYSVHYGPGANFIDFQLLPTPRYDGPEWHGNTSLEYKSNGEQVYGRQNYWGGGEDYGYRISYGVRTGNDYHAGNGMELPTSYKSRDLNIALGRDFTPDSRLEFNYLRLDQGDVEFPGLVFDINKLQTDGYEVKYVLENHPAFDRFTADGWYNRTKFTGDTSRLGKNKQIPSIRPDFELGPDQFLVTDVDGMSAGYRFAFTWGDRDELCVTYGTDLIRQGTQLNDIVPPHDTSVPFPPFSAPYPARNYPIPRSNSYDFGFFVENSQPLTECWRLNLGGRVDIVSTTAREQVPGMGEVFGFPPMLTETNLSTLKGVGVDQHFTPWSLYATTEYQLNPCYTFTAGAGHSMRPPTLTELYAVGSFIGSLQPGLTFVQGDPALDPEHTTQIDAGVRADLDTMRLSLSGFFAWVHNYIIYDYIPATGVPFTPGQSLMNVAYGNTDLATLTGFEFLGEHDFSCSLTGFAVMSYVEGRDHSRGAPSRLGAMIRQQNGDPAGPRSLVAGVDEEWLPGIPPLMTRLGVRWHDPNPTPNWAVELEARIVDSQEKVASSLFEQRTGGFTVWNLRGYWRPYSDLTIISGVENFTDKFYREHLDYRPGLGVFRPGLNAYVAAELSY